MRNVLRYLLAFSVVTGGFYGAHQFRRRQPTDPRSTAAAPATPAATGEASQCEVTPQPGPADSLPVAALVDTERTSVPDLRGEIDRRVVSSIPQLRRDTGERDDLDQRPADAPPAEVAKLRGTESSPLPSDYPAFDQGHRDRLVKPIKVDLDNPPSDITESHVAPADALHTPANNPDDDAKRSSPSKWDVLPSWNEQPFAMRMQETSQSLAQDDDALGRRAPDESSPQADVDHAPRELPIRSPTDAAPWASADSSPSAPADNSKDQDSTTAQRDSVATVRCHRIRDGDTLPRLAERFLGNRDRYLEIFAANKDVLFDPRLLPVGLQITIPDPDNHDAISIDSSSDDTVALGASPETSSGMQAIPATALPRQATE